MYVAMIRGTPVTILGDCAPLEMGECQDAARAYHGDVVKRRLSLKIYIQWTERIYRCPDAKTPGLIPFLLALMQAQLVTVSCCLIAIFIRNHYVSLFHS